MKTENQNPLQPTDANKTLHALFGAASIKTPPAIKTAFAEASAKHRELTALEAKFGREKIQTLAALSLATATADSMPESRSDLDAAYATKRRSIKNQRAEIAKGFAALIQPFLAEAHAKCEAHTDIVESAEAMDLEAFGFAPAVSPFVIGLRGAVAMIGRMAEKTLDVERCALASPQSLAPWLTAELTA